jgi:hypothetical protein
MTQKQQVLFFLSFVFWGHKRNDFALIQDLLILMEEEEKK